MSVKIERPEYIKNFVKPKNTEIKYITGNWYLYNKSSVWDPVYKKKIKKSGSIIGKITPTGLVESKRKKKEAVQQGPQSVSPSNDAMTFTPQDQASGPAPEGSTAVETDPVSKDNEPIGNGGNGDNRQPTPSGCGWIQGTAAAPGNILPDKESILSDVVEAGPIVYLIKRTEMMRANLQTVFPNYWIYIYAIAILRTIYACPLRDLPLNFNHSLLCYLYPNIVINKQNIADTLYILGSQRNLIRQYMLLEMQKGTQYLIMDGHRMLTSARNMPLKSIGYDTKARYHEQLNVLYVFSTNGDGSIGFPSYYKQFAGHTIDSNALKSILDELKIAGDQIAIGDTGMGSQERYDQMSNLGLRYIIPEKRNTVETRGIDLSSWKSYQGHFTYKRRAISYKILDRTTYRIIVYLDHDQQSKELATYISKSESSNDKELTKVIKALNKTEKSISKLEANRAKAEKEIAKLEDKYQTAVGQASVAEAKFGEKQAAASATEQRLADARKKLQDLEAAGASPNKIAGAQHSVDFQQGSFSNRDAERTHAWAVYLTKKKRAEEILTKLSNKKEELLKINTDIQGFETNITILERRQDTCQQAVDHGLQMDIQDGEFTISNEDEDDTEYDKSNTFGTMTIRTTVMDLPAEKIYRLYKQRQSIEQYFKTYDNTLAQDVSYMKNQFSEEGWLFLNHLSGLMAFDTLKNINEFDKNNDISIRGWYNTLRLVQCGMIDGTWQFPHLKENVVTRCEKLGFDPTDIASLGLE